MKSERLAYWYFRLNGFLTNQNYIIHPRVDGSGSQRTEIDTLGVRFPHKAEKIERPNCEFETMADEDIFKTKDKIYIIIADAKKGCCDLNEAWTNPDKKNIHDFLRVVGAFEDRNENIDDIARKLYGEGFFENDSYCVSLFCVGKSINLTLRSKYPKIPQKTWYEVLEFIYNRFKKYEELKRDHSQWDCDGKQLWDCFERNNRNESNFKNQIISCLE